MSSQAMRAFGRADAHVDARQKNFERQLGRFRPALRPAVRALASRHARLAELSESFPALLAALAWPRHGVDARPIIAAVISGAPLESLARLAGVPLWLRRLSPETLIAPLPVLPDSPFIRHRIANHLPKHAKHAARWFEAVSYAARWADDTFALWCAANFYKPPRYRRRHSPSARLLCLWAWYSLHPDTLGFALMETRWNEEMQLKAAMHAASRWQDTLDLMLHVPEGTARTAWHRPAVVEGYAFLPLLDFADIRDEAQAMQNCLLGYGEALRSDTSQLWSVRKDGVRVATLEMRRMGANPFPVLNQLLGMRNADAPREVWLTAHQWLAGQAVHTFGGEAQNEDLISYDRTRWQALWKPYWLAKRIVPHWLPLKPNRYTLWDI